MFRSFSSLHFLKKTEMSRECTVAHHNKSTALGMMIEMLSRLSVAIGTKQHDAQNAGLIY